ncbi:helix-turn-helix transcriptional regulator [Dyella jiangningensis]|uniref:AlpA family transcriptional regulator n=1 Tax=Dyella jiangningensis TaxID=1379159 RepID=A0A328P0N1_9GAMM|nr:AlpA family phage regulatory protein [Dyella jiangningensis]RAO75787.1 hypothetical protein CA260_17265 [Dyella jiangningensis]
MTKRFIKLDQVKQMTSLSRAAIYKRIAHGAFPAQVKLGATSVWLESEIEGWIQRKVDERDQSLARSLGSFIHGPSK